ncbi:MAG: two-component sensor histidine kinase [Lachnospiraceae bacterium]|nr:two-component sensor histidine kinase [Lachnospiraceae bacterium]
MMKSIRARLTVTYIILVAVMVVAIWGVNRWYLEEYYISDKVQSLNEAYTAIDQQIASNNEDGITIAEAMRQEQDAQGNVTEGNLRRIVREFSDTTNVSILMIDNSAEETAIYSTARDAQLLKNRMDRYIFGQDRMNIKVLEEYENYKIQQTFDPWREGMYLESWGFFSDNSTAFIMNTPLSSIRESVELSNRFLAYVGIFAAASGAILVYFLTKKMVAPINELSVLSEKMSHLNFDVKFESNGHEVEEIRILGNSMNTLSDRLKENIGELKSANNQLQKDIEEKTRIDEMRKEFIANVSHELKTPIALIQGYAEGLQEGMADDKESRDYYCDVIVDEAGKMNKMVKQLLTLSSLESGNDKMIMERFDLAELIQGVISAARILIEQNEITVKFEAVDPIYVWADEFKIEEVVTNYLSNAINHASGEKIIVIRINTEQGRTRVSVFNTGTPIPEEALPNLWTKFYKVDKARTRAYGGSGIGLSIVKAIMDGHGQECGVENWENGVEFWFTLDSSNN